MPASQITGLPHDPVRQVPIQQEMLAQRVPSRQPEPGDNLP
jgi:hypothetical protein